MDSEYCESHFDTCHDQKNVTFEKLKIRMDNLGGLMTRDEPQPESDEEIPKPKNWLFADDDDGTKNGVFVTNNFSHRLK
jgi:hypothetical protein